MIWKGKEVKTIGDVMRAMDALTGPAEAQKFMTLMRADSPHADQNVGYLTGYFNAEKAQRLRQWCGVEHPIFGNRTPTASEAFRIGMRLGRRVKRESLQ